VELHPMAEGEFQRYMERAIKRYAQENIKAGYRTAEDAERRSQQDHLRLLPLGLETPGTHLLVIREKASQRAVGALWLKTEDDGRPIGFIYDIFLEEEERGKGLGKATMRALEEFARKEGLKALYLHVFAHNPIAIRLYQSSGYKFKSMNMEKLLDD
jgi:ribosomal protein S18 acetylase RimI-like enzyme